MGKDLRFAVDFEEFIQIAGPRMIFFYIFQPEKDLREEIMKIFKFLMMMRQEKLVLEI